MNRNRYSRRTVLKGASAAAVVGGLAALPIACGDDDDDEAPSPGGNGETPSPSESASPGAPAEVQTLTVRQYNEPVGLDPHTLFRIEAENIASNVFAALTAFDVDSGDPIADLADSWEIADDAMTYTFTLVQGAQWHQDMGEFTSEDVKYSFERVMDPAFGSPYGPELNNLDSVEAPDPYTVVFHLKGPDANFLYQVGNYHQGQIVNQQAVEQYGDQIQRNPVGLGPFAMTEWAANSHMILQRHDAYHKGPAILEEIRFNLIQDVNAAEAAIINGEVDVAMSIGTVPERLARLEEAGLEFPFVQGHQNSIWMFNPEFGNLDDVRLRQAIAYGMDGANILEQFNPYASVAYSILPPYMTAYSEDVPKYEYDPERARALLDEVGVDTLNFQMLTTAAQGGVSDDLLARQAQLTEVGINLEFDIVENSVYNSRRTAGDFEVSNRVYPAVNPDTLLFGYLHPDNLPPVGFNGARYDNPELTALLEQARATLDDDERMALYADVQRIAMEDLPYLPVSTSATYWAAYPRVKGVKVDRLSAVNWHQVFVEAEA